MSVESIQHPSGSTEDCRALVGRLAAGWSPGQTGWLDRLRRFWESRFGAEVSLHHVRTGLAELHTSLPGVRLRGADDVRMLLVATGADEVRQEIRDFRATLPVNALAAVIVCVPQLDQEVGPLLRSTTVVPLHRDELVRILTNAAPVQAFRHLIVTVLPREYLNPFNYINPVEGTMFAGRERVLDRLRYETSTSFAIAGPSRLGKTSILKQHRRILIHDRDPDALATYYVDWYDCPDLSYSSIASHLLRRMAGDLHIRHALEAGIQSGLKRISSDLGRPVTLLCDETDRVCSTTAFNDLGMAARAGHCRLILAGRADLFRWINQRNSTLASRLSPLQLEPLSDAAAQALLLEPLTHLGLEVVGPQDLAKQVLAWTGRMPHLIQFYGQRIAALGAETGRVDLKTANLVHHKQETASYLTSVIPDITDPLARFLALVLLRERPGGINPCTLQTYARIEGVPIPSHARSVEITDELLLCNLLTYDGHVYRISSQGLAEHAQRLGYLTNGLAEARAHLKQASANSAVSGQLAV